MPEVMRKRHLPAKMALNEKNARGSHWQLRVGALEMEITFGFLKRRS